MAVDLRRAERGEIEAAAVIEVELRRLVDDRLRIARGAEREPAGRHAADGAALDGERDRAEQLAPRSDHCDALELVFREGKAGEEYAIGGRNEWKNLDLVRKICDVLNEVVGKGPGADYKSLIRFVTDRAGHDFRYAIDSTKIETRLGWKQSPDFGGNLKTTVLWYVTKFQGGTSA